MTRCKVGRLHPTLSTPDQALLSGWLTDGRDARERRVPAETLSAALRADGHDVGPTTLKDHRAGRCACHKDR